MEIDIQKIQCAGVSFTDGLGLKFIKYYDTICKYKDKSMTYVDIQNLFEKEIEISKSATRVDIPFLFNSGLIREYKNEEIKLSDFLTDLGKCYYEFLKIKEIVSEEEDEYLIKKIGEIGQLVILDSLFYRKMTKNDEYYLKLLKNIYKYKTINEKEFYLTIKYEDDNELLEKYITEYRNGEIDINLVNANNTYQYTKNLLIQSGIVFENKEEKRLILNKDKKAIIEELLK